MKRIAIAIACLIACSFFTPIYAQWNGGGGRIYYNGGNVGIGVSNPTQKLEVSGSGLFDNVLTGNVFVGIEGIYSRNGNNPGIPISTYTGAMSTFNFANSEIQVNSSSGKIGIGKSPTSYKFDVNGTVNATGFYLNGQPFNAGNWTPSGSAIYFNSGNVGIGTSTPGSSYKLDVNGALNVGSLFFNGIQFSPNAQQPVLSIAAGGGNGIRFWNSDEYKIHMGNTAEYHYGPVTDYSIKTNMSNDTGRGWTWGTSGVAPIAALSKDGNMKIAGSMEATSFLVNGVAIGGGSSVWTTTGSDINYTLGKVGIGVSPVQSLDIVGRTQIRSSASSAGTWYADNSGNASAFFGLTGNASSSSIGIYHGGNWRFLVSQAGNVGIGTSTPAYDLDVSGTINATSILVNGQPISTGSGSTQWVASGSDIHFDDGAVGIGTPLSANPNGYKLAVNGKIGAKEVQVENTSTIWPDYVFESKYDLPSLDKVESFINLNRHLPDVPSANEIATDGHQLGKMDVVLLKKIEELTLYVIELKKEIEQLKKN